MPSLANPPEIIWTVCWQSFILHREEIILIQVDSSTVANEIFLSSSRPLQSKSTMWSSFWVCSVRWTDWSEGGTSVRQCTADHADAQIHNCSDAVVALHPCEMPMWARSVCAVSVMQTMGLCSWAKKTVYEFHITLDISAISNVYVLTRLSKQPMSTTDSCIFLNK